jgi:uncharacterized protein
LSPADDAPGLSRVRVVRQPRGASLARRFSRVSKGYDPVNISRYEQRVLHVLAQGGRIQHDLDEAGHLASVRCFNRDGHLLSDCTLPLFRKLKRRRLIASRGGAPYRITRLGLDAVRAQADQR